MNGKTARMIRKAIGNSGETQYQEMKGTRRFKQAFPPGHPENNSYRGVSTFTSQLDPACGRKRYQAMKRRYKEVRAGEMFGRLAWPDGV